MPSPAQALGILTGQVGPPVLITRIKETSRSEKQRREMCSLWPHWEVTPMSVLAGPDRKFIFPESGKRSVQLSSSGQGLEGPVHHDPQLFWLWPVPTEQSGELLELCGTLSRGRSLLCLAPGFQPCPPQHGISGESLILWRPLSP